MLSLHFATRNAHKTREFAEILGPHFALSDLSQIIGVPKVEETGRTFEENAILKATTASRFLPGLVVSDDSGLEVMSLQGAPGVRSARYAGPHASDQENIAKLLGELEGSDKRDARFYCAIALARDGKTLAVFHGAIAGTITSESGGTDGFGYDPIFIPIGHEQTFGELGARVKNRISHRAVAISRLSDYLARSA